MNINVNGPLSVIMNIVSLMTLVLSFENYGMYAA